TATLTVGSAATLVTTVNGGNAFGAATIDNSGTLAITGSNGSMNGNTNTIIFRPGSNLFIDQTGQAGGSLFDRWGDTNAISLTSGTFRIMGIAGDTAAPETVGNFSFGGDTKIVLDIGGGNGGATV